MSYLDVFPAGVTVEPLVHVVVQALAQSVHEWCARCDAVGIKVRFLRLLRGYMVTLGRNEKLKSPFYVNFSHYMRLDCAHAPLGLVGFTGALYLTLDALLDVTSIC